MFKPIATLNIQASNVSSTVSTIKKITSKSPFIYGAKKTSFRVKRRKTYWEQVESMQKVVKQQIIKNIIMDMSGTTDKEDITMKAVSPVLALTLILLDQGILSTTTIKEYTGDINDTTLKRFTPKVYAYNSHVYDSTSGVKTSEDGTETYTPSLPPYYHIHSVSATYGDYTDPTTQSTSKCFRTDTANVKDLTDKQRDAINYLWDQGFLRKIADNKYGNKSSDIASLRSGYGYGPACITSFLNLVRYGKKMIPEVIFGLLICEDSGMTIKDAIKAVREFLNPGYRSSSFNLSYFDGLSEVYVLSILEEIGTYFLLSLIGRCYQKNIHFTFPLSTVTERNIYEVGYLMGDTVSDLREYLIYILENKLYTQDSIEVFNVTTPSVMTSDGTVSKSVIEIGGDTKVFSDISTTEGNPISLMFDVESCLDDISAFNYLVNPRKGYDITDFINQGLMSHFIEQMVESFNEETVTDISNDYLKTQVYSDYGVAPRVATSEDSKSLTFDYEHCTPLYPNGYYKNEYGKSKSLTVEVKTATISIDTTKLTKSGETPTVSGSEFSVSCDVSLVSDDLSSLSDSLTKSIIDFVKTKLFYGEYSGNTLQDSLKFSVFFGLKNQVSEFLYDDQSKQLINLKLDPVTPVETYSSTYTSSAWGAQAGSFTAKTLQGSFTFLPVSLDITPKEAINKLFRDNNCTLELYYRNINQATTQEDKATMLSYFYDVYALAMIRIIIINSFCNQSSINSNDVMTKFFKTFSGYLKNYLDIETSSLS